MWRDKSMKIFVFGSSGMLGRYFVKYLKNNNFHNLSVVALTRNELDLSNVNEKDIKDTLVKYKVSSGDVVLNAAGIINVMVGDVGDEVTKHINSTFPHMLSKVCEGLNVKMIHITTDCVFSGEVGNYDENQKHDCHDVYGKTKSDGEPKNCCVIRTSIIGEEFNAWKEDSITQQWRPFKKLATCSRYCKRNYDNYGAWRFKRDLQCGWRV